MNRLHHAMCACALALAPWVCAFAADTDLAPSELAPRGSKALSQSLTATLQQNGVGNTFAVDQWGQHIAFNGSQAGSANRATVMQGGLDNQAWSQQSGQDNEASIVQDGLRNRAEIDQIGNANYARIEQYGREGTARITQYGDGKTATIIQY